MKLNNLICFLPKWTELNHMSLFWLILLHTAELGSATLLGDSVTYKLEKSQNIHVHSFHFGIYPIRILELSSMDIKLVDPSKVDSLQYAWT